MPSELDVYRMLHNAAFAAAQLDLEACQQLIGYHFSKIDLLFEALQAPGTFALSATGQPLKRGNENLAIVGDLALATVLSAEWYKSGLNTEKVHWQKQWRDRLLSDKHLASVSRESGLIDFEQKVKTNLAQLVAAEKRAASLFEAVAGAIFLDAADGVGAVREFVRHIGLLE